MTSTSPARVSLEVLADPKAAPPLRTSTTLVVAFLATTAIGALGASIAALAIGIRANSRANDALSSVDQARLASLEAAISTLQTPGVLLSADPLPPPGYNLSGSLSSGTGEWSAGTQMPEERSDEHAVPCVSPFPDSTRTARRAPRRRCASNSHWRRARLLLQAGTIVMLGGVNASGGVTDSVWHFDPVPFSPPPPFCCPALSHTPPSCGGTLRPAPSCARPHPVNEETIPQSVLAHC